MSFLGYGWPNRFLGIPMLVGAVMWDQERSWWDYTYVRRAVPLVSIMLASMVSYFAEEAKKLAKSS